MGSMRRVLFFLILALGPQLHAGECIDLFKADAEVILSREPGPELPAAYVENMKRVISAFTELLKPHDETYEVFIESMRELHRTEVLGETPSEFYWPVVHQLRNGKIIPPIYSEALHQAGKFRNEVKVIPVDESLVQVKELSAGTSEKIRLASLEQERIETHPSGIQITFFRPAIDGITEDALPTYEFARTTLIEYRYPPAKYLKKYLEQIKQSSDQVRSSLARYDKTETLKHLARYYHLLMVAHPFNRANNSLFMTEVNVVLTQLGMKPVYHGDLDYIIRSMSSDQAEKAFLTYVGD